MNDDQVKQEAIKWLGSLRETAEQAKGFVLDQAPDTIRELVVLGRVETAIHMGAGLATLLIAALLARWATKIDWKAEDFDLERVILVTIIKGIGAGIFFLIAISVITGSTHDFVSAWFAPRIYVIETLAGMMGKIAGH